MKQAKGFITEDGRFFENQTEAEYHEARRSLEIQLDAIEIAEGRYVDPDKFIDVLTSVIPSIERFIHAYQKDPEHAQRYEDDIANERQRLREALSDTPSDPAQGNGAAIAPGRPYRGSRESPPGVLEQSPSRYVSVPNVGRGEQSEELPDDR
jgi:hypothetical protein